MSPLEPPSLEVTDSSEPVLRIVDTRQCKAMTFEEQKLALPQLREHLSQDPYYAQRIAEGGDKFLHNLMRSMAVGCRAYLPEHYQRPGESVPSSITPIVYEYITEPLPPLGVL